MGERERARAIERYMAGEKPAAIYGSRRRSRSWFYKWLKRSRAGSKTWYVERPRKSPRQTASAVEQQVAALRGDLRREGIFYGADAIRWELEQARAQTVPSVRTIGRMLVRRQLVERRTKRYEPKGKNYPSLQAVRPGDVHQSDFVGPVRFYSLNTVDLATGRGAAQPLLTRAGQQTVDALWASWGRLGMPRHQQVDNEAVFYGSPTHPRGMGILIRLCLLYGVEVWFIPPGEPWRNGVVEKFNDHWQQKFFRRLTMTSAAQLVRASLSFEHRHNSRYRYRKLKGKTPAEALQDSTVALRFPPNPQPPQHPLPKPETGRCHLIRFIRSNQLVGIFGESSPVPPEAACEYVQATVDVASQELQIYLEGKLLDVLALLTVHDVLAGET